jgi:hypothetical protein
MKMMGAQFPAEIAGGDAHDALSLAKRADGLNAGAHRVLYVRGGQPVDYDFHRRADVGRQACSG